MVLALQTCSRMRGAPLEGVESFHADITSLHQREDEGRGGKLPGAANGAHQGPLIFRRTSHRSGK